MPKQSFPYSTVSSVVFIPQDEPLGALTARIMEGTGIIGSYESLWHERMQLIVPNYASNPGVAQLADPLVSLVATDIIVAFETFLRQLDDTLQQTVEHLFVWPPKKKRNKLDFGNPYGFFFYNLEHVRDHFRKIFHINAFYGIPFGQLCDYILFRHSYAHRNGFPSSKDVSRFQYFRIHKKRRLLLDINGLPILYKTIQTSAVIINNRIARVILAKWFKSLKSVAWSRNSRRFYKLCKALSFFGSLKRNEEDIKGYYQAAVEQFTPNKIALTYLDQEKLVLEKPWNRINFSDFAT